MHVHTLKNSDDLTIAFENYNELLYKYLYVRLRNQELAEDLTQDVFVKAWKNRESFDPKKSALKTWLFVIATNTLTDHYRTNKTHLHEELTEDVESFEDIALQATQNDLIQFVLEKLAQLSEREQEMITLRYVQGFSAKEVAKILNMEYSATKVAFHRAIKRLKTLCNSS